MRMYPYVYTSNSDTDKSFVYFIVGGEVYKAKRKPISIPKELYKKWIFIGMLIRMNNRE